MKRLFFLPLLVFFLASDLHAAQSTITEAEGLACMGYDKSRKQTEEEALTNAKRNASEYASTYIKSDTKVKDFQLEKDLIEAYAYATVKLIQEIERTWYKDASSGDCCKIKIKAEVVPDPRRMNRIDKGISDERSTPLFVQVWSNKKGYKESENIKIYLRGNKPFYARVVYKGIRSGIFQLLPNPYRSDNYFNGGVVYEIPGGKDQFEMVVTGPFGTEEVHIYASTAPLGEIDLRAHGAVFKVKNSLKDIGINTRGVRLREKSDDQNNNAAEFAEEILLIRTKK